MIKIALTHCHTVTPLMPLGNKPFENTVGKGEIACNEQFLLYPVFSTSLREISAILHQIQNCCLQTVSIWTSLKFCRLVMGLSLFYYVYNICMYKTLYILFGLT